MASPRRSRVPPPGAVHSRRSVVLLLVALMATGFPLPYTVAAVVPLAWSGFESVRAIAKIRAQSGGPARVRRILSNLLGLVLVGLLASVVLLPYAVYGTAKRLQDCNLGANTAIAAAECSSEFSSDLESILSGVLSLGPPSGG